MSGVNQPDKKKSEWTERFWKNEVSAFKVIIQQMKSVVEFGSKLKEVHDKQLT